jgi:hypothetical protein
MARPIRLAAAALGIARPGAALFLALLTLAAVIGRDTGPSDDGRGVAPGGASARDDGGTLRVTLPRPRGDAYTRCVIEDDDGRPLMYVHHSVEGELSFGLGEDGGERVVGYRSPGGRLGVGVGGAGPGFEYRRCRGRPAAVSVHNGGSGREARLLVTPEGALAPNPDAPPGGPNLAPPVP